MIKIGIIGPSETEIMPFIRKISNVKLSEIAMLKFYSGEYEGIDVVSVFSGVCKVNAAIATQILISQFNVTHIILTGVAGALSNQLKIGDIVISSEVAYHDVAPGILTEYHPWMKENYFKADDELLKMSKTIAGSFETSVKCYVGKIVTGEAFITHNERERLIEQFNPLCVDMESASVAHTCYVNNIPFIVIRSMTDNADENGISSFEENIDRAALNSIKFVEELIKKVRKN